MYLSSLYQIDDKIIEKQQTISFRFLYRIRHIYVIIPEIRIYSFLSDTPKVCLAVRIICVLSSGKSEKSTLLGEI